MGVSTGCDAAPTAKSATPRSSPGVHDGKFWSSPSRPSDRTMIASAPPLLKQVDHPPGPDPVGPAEQAQPDRVDASLDRIRHDRLGLRRIPV
jgi:hypothetical protein